ncbi:MAG: T9SS type A sorting domain-containing protein [Bacteroidia bacterium]|nr:T9SS type A sorting domain-containing protein [Bacteroidia bacterium]
MKKGFIRQEVKMKQSLRLIVASVVFAAALTGAGIFIYLQLGSSKSAEAAVETLPAGSYIINMGVIPQTVANGLKPYGLVYEMVTVYNVPVKWVIDPSKAKDGPDFTYNAVNYSGGTFIIPGDLITPTIQSRITYWNSLGVQGLYTTTPVSVPVYSTINGFPRVVVDTISGNQSIIYTYFDNAGIPSSAYRPGTPASVTSCDDIWVNPHGDPTWLTHGSLYNFVINQRGYIWSQCHSVSMLENVFNPLNPSQKMNFLSTTGLQCWGSAKCGAVAESHVKFPTAPFTHHMPADPVMQFMGSMSGACLGGSEQWFYPLSTGTWRTSTNRVVTTATGVSPREGVLMAYGHAFGNTSNGMVMYEGGHDLNASGSATDKVAAQRAFLNFCLLAGRARMPQLVSSAIQTSFISGMNGHLMINVSGGTPPYTYQWSSNIAGTFGSPDNDTTTFAPALNSSNQSGSISVVITDACNRIVFESRSIAVTGSALPVSMLWTKATRTTQGVKVEWATASERNNDYFTVFRSSNQTDFVPIGKVKGAGNSNETKSYQFTDQQAPAGYLLYRLAQTDFDGTAKMFNPVSVNNTSKVTRLSVFPNPVTSASSVSFTSETAGEAVLEIWSMNGQQISRQPFVLVEGSNSLRLDGTSALVPGKYFLRIVMNREVAAIVQIIR